MKFTDQELRAAKAILGKADSLNVAFEELPIIEQLELVLRIYRHKFHALLDDGCEKNIVIVRSLLIDRNGIVTISGEANGQTLSFTLSQTDSDNVTRKIPLSKMNHSYDYETNGCKYILIFDESTQLE